MMAPRPLALAALREFGSTWVLAPHPDDEALGCGGLIALLRRCGQPVQALLVSDGSQSHPRSRQYDAAARAKLRDAEWQQALACLGVARADLHRLGWPDGQVPAPGDARFDAAVQGLRGLLERHRPATVVLPWRRDPHPDHRATHALFAEAARTLPFAIRSLEYAVWLGERAELGDRPRPDEVTVWQLDIRRVLPAKRRAIACHRSQAGAVFTDDADGFTLPATLLRRAQAPFERYFERRDAVGLALAKPIDPSPGGRR